MLFKDYAHRLQRRVRMWVKFKQPNKHSAVGTESILSGERLLEDNFSHICSLASDPQVYANVCR